MATLFLNRKAISVKREGDHLLVHDHTKQDTPQRVPLIHIDNVIVVGEPAITFSVLTTFMRKAIPCHFLDLMGRWRGQLDTQQNHYGERRMLQYQRTADPDFALALGKRLIEAKLRNTRRVLQRLYSNCSLRFPKEFFRSHYASINYALSLVPFVKEMNKLLGFEGIAAKQYFSLLSFCFPTTLSFHGRCHHPPKDAANALLSWTYTLLLSEMMTSLRVHGLDPACGCIHKNQNRMPALALDLIEPFRPAFADLLVLNVVNHKIIRPEHFITHSETVLLTEEGRHIFFKCYERALSRPFRDPITHQKTTLKHAIDCHVKNFLHVLYNGMDQSRFFTLP